MKRHLSDEQIDKLAEVGADSIEGDEELSGHLECCAECRQELSLARTVDHALSSVPRMVPPPELFDGVMSALVAARAKQRRSAAMVASMATAAMVFVSWWLFSGGAAQVALEALEVARSVRLAAHVATAVGEVLPLEMLVACALVLLGSTAVLGRMMARMTSGPDVTATAGS